MAQLMVASIYDALLEAGASEEKSRAAAQDLVAVDDRFNALDRRIDTLDRDLSSRIERVHARIDNVETKLGSRIDNVETKLDGLAQRMNIQFGLVAAGVVAIIVRTFV